MRYENDRLGFALTLPDDWRLAPNTTPPTFISDCGYILVKASTILPAFANPASRKRHMAEAGVVFRDACFLGDETSNVVRLDNHNVNEGWVSAVRDGIHYEVSWDNNGHPQMMEAVDQLLWSFIFPSTDRASHSVNAASYQVAMQRPREIEMPSVVSDNPAISRIPTGKQSRRFLGAFIALLLAAGVVRLYTSIGRQADKINPSSIGTHRPGELWTNPRDGQRYAWIPAGTFTMGCIEPRSLLIWLGFVRGCKPTEYPRHEVAITKSFWIGQTEVTVEAWKRFAKAASDGARRLKDWSPTDNPGWSDNTFPMQGVGAQDAEAFCSWAGGRLPTEAEWEYAARAGTREAWYGKLEDIAWYIGNSEYKPHRVAAKQPNALGLYDVLGNVWERVGDQFEQHYYEKSPPRDPKGPSSAEFDLGNGVRGGGYFSAGQNVLLSTREGANVQNSESVGVRCVLETKF